MARRSLLLCLCVCLLMAGLSGCSATPSLTPEQAAVRELARNLEAHLGPELWREVRSQTWYQGAHTTEAGARLMRLLLGVEGADVAAETRAILAAYPEGIDAAAAAALERLLRLRPATELVSAAWLRDGIDAGESFLISLLDRPTAFGDYVLNVLERRDVWFTDGVDNNEQRLLRLARATGSSSVSELARQSLESGRYAVQQLSLSAEAETDVVLLWTPQTSQEARRRTLDLVLELAPRVASFAGHFSGDTLVIVLDAGASLCSADANPGRINPALGSLYGGMQPGIIRLAPGCVQAQSLAHELTHIFAAGQYPTWFAEGIADVVAYHLTGRVGYGGGSGRLQLERRENDTREPFTRSPYYQEAARGTAMLLELYRLLGPDAISKVLHSTGQESRTTGARALELILEQTPPEKVADVKAVFARWVEGYVP